MWNGGKTHHLRKPPIYRNISPSWPSKICPIGPSSWCDFLRRLKGFFGVELVAFSPILLVEEIRRTKNRLIWRISHDLQGFYTFQLVNAGFLKHQQYEKDRDQKVGKTHTCHFRGTPTPQISNNYFWIEMVTGQSFFQRWTWTYVLRIYYCTIYIYLSHTTDILPHKNLILQTKIPCNLSHRISNLETFEHKNLEFP